MTTRHPAPRRSGAPPQPPSGLRRPHTPRSHVFSGVPPPDLHTLNLQRQLDEARTRADDLAKQVASQAEEIQALKEAAAATTTTTTAAAAGASSKAQPHARPSAASPSPPAPLRRSVSDSMPEPLFPVDAAVTEHLAFLSTLIDGAVPPPNPNSATVWGALTGYYDALDKKCAEVSAQACVLAAEKDALLAPGGLPQPLPSLEGVSLASSETPSPTNTNGSGGPGAVSAPAAAATAAVAAVPDVRVQAARVLSRNSSVMSQPHPAYPSGASPSPVSAVRRAASGGAYAAPRVPAEVFDFVCDCFYLDYQQKARAGGGETQHTHTPYSFGRCPLHPRSRPVPPT